MAMQAPIFARQHNTGTNTGTALKINIAMASVCMGDMAMGKLWSHIMAGAGATALAKYSGLVRVKYPTGIHGLLFRYSRLLYQLQH